MKPIANRIYRAIFIVSLISMITMVSTILLVNETLEQTMLKMQPTLEENPTFGSATPEQAFVWLSTSHQVAYVPKNHALPAGFPSLFSALESQEMAEVDIGEHTYLLNKQHSADGTLYIARNISAFEEREAKFNLLLIVLVLLIALLSWWLARLSSQTITTPLEKLSQTIQQLPVGPYLPSLKTNYQDQELYDIAVTFNLFLTELNAYMKREKHLLHLASHELRTPIAIIAGAIEIIESRAQLNQADQITLQRLKRANAEMAANIETILQLARATPQPEKENTFLIDLIDGVINDMSDAGANTNRIQLHPSEKPIVKANPTLVKMLLRNLLQNALQHTTGPIHLYLQNHRLIISDEGNGLTAEQQQRLKIKASPSSGGLGLYIVTMICEKLNWQLSWESEAQSGTIITIDYKPQIMDRTTDL